MKESRKMINKKSFVSVILPTYNRAHQVGRAIQSVLDQTYQDFEIIVVDDASTDNTEEVVQGFTDERVGYIRQKENAGAGAARNIGIQLSQGDYIAFQDSDDEWLPEKLEKQIEVFKTVSAKVGVVYTDMLRIHSDGRAEYWNSPTLTDGCIIDAKKLEYQVLNIGIQSTLIKKECFKKAGVFDEKFPRFIDLELFIRLSKHFGFYHIQEPLVKYYVTEGISSNNRALSIARILLLEKYFEDVKKNKKFLAKQYFRIGANFHLCGNVKEGRDYLIKATKTYPLDVGPLLFVFHLYSGEDIYGKLTRLYRIMKSWINHLKKR